VSDKPNLKVLSGGISSSTTTVSARVEPLDLSSYPKGRLKYFTNASEEHKGTVLALNPEIVDTIFTFPKTEYTGIYSKNGLTWVVAENFEYTSKQLQKDQ
jgi:hypothetical protein